LNIALIGTIAQSTILFRKDMILSLVSKEHRVFVFCVDFTNITKKQIKELGAIPVEYTLNRSGLNPLKDILDTIKLSKKLKKFKIDISFSYFVKPVIFGTIASKLAGVSKRFAMLEGLGYVFTNLPNGVTIKQNILRVVQVFLYRLSMPLLEKIIFLNPDDPKDLIEKYNIKVKQLEVLGAIGLNLDEYPYSKVQTNIIKFIFVGRLLAEKGIFEYVKATQIIKKEFPKVDFIVLGGLDTLNPGGLKQVELDSLLKDDIITYVGYVNNVYEWIKNSSVFVLPSYREGVPRSTQEAMAIGRAVITTNVAGCRETVIDGINGFLIPPFKIDELVTSMKKFIQNPELIEQMGNESYKIAKDKFDAKKVNDKLIKILEI